MSHTIPARANVDLIDQKYADWKRDPNSVDQNWAMFFEGFELGLTQPAPRQSLSGSAAIRGQDEVEMPVSAQVVSLVNSFRTLGHTAAWLDPLDDEAPDQPLLNLDELGFEASQLDDEVSTHFYEGGRRMKLREMIDRLRRTYCGKVGFEFMHIQTPEVRNWVRERVEAGSTSRGHLLKRRNWR